MVERWANGVVVCFGVVYLSMFALSLENDGELEPNPVEGQAS